MSIHQVNTALDAINNIFFSFCNVNVLLEPLRKRTSASCGVCVCVCVFLFLSACVCVCALWSELWFEVEFVGLADEMATEGRHCGMWW